jgi:hypothetical protein
VDIHIKTHDTAEEAAENSTPHVSKRATMRRTRALLATDMRESMRPRTRTRVTTEKEKANGLRRRYAEYMCRMLAGKHGGKTTANAHA